MRCAKGPSAPTHQHAYLQVHAHSGANPLPPLLPRERITVGETALGSVLMKNIHVREVLLTFMKLLTRLRAIEQDRAAAGSTSPQGVDSSDEHAFLLMLLMRESVEAVRRASPFRLLLFFPSPSLLQALTF